jgi:hypothetical protein
MRAYIRSSWLAGAIIAGASYGLIGIVFALPSGHARIWRLAAWISSGVVYVLHVVYERYWRRHSILATTLHATLAVALGAFILAAGANIHATMVQSHAPYARLLLALVLWPIITAIPAFVVGLVFVSLLALLPISRSTE